MYIAIIVIFIFATLIIYTSKIGVDDEQEIEAENCIQDQVPQPEKSKEIVLYFNTDTVKFAFYHVHILLNYQSRKFYKKVVVDKLFIDEPFHTTFVQLLQIYDHTEAWIKSKKTKEIKLKIRTKNGSFQEGTSFKVYSVSEIIFDFLGNILEHFDNYRYSKNDQKNVILAALVWKVDLVMELKYLCVKDVDDMEKRDCLAKKILKYHEKNHDVFQILCMLEAGHENLLFVFESYKKALQWQQEYPYVQKDKEQYKNIRLEDLVTKNSKKLISLDAF